MRSEVLTALLMKISVCPEITHCRLVCSSEVSDELSESVISVVKRWGGCEADHSLSVAEIKIVWNCSPPLITYIAWS